MLKTVVDTMLAQLHPNVSWAKLTESSNTEDGVSVFDDSDTARLIYSRPMERKTVTASSQRISKPKPPTSKASLDYDALGVNNPCGWKQPVFPWHNPQRCSAHIRGPMTGQEFMSNTHYSKLMNQSSRSMEHERKPTDEKHSVYDYLIDKDTDITYLAPSESIRPQLRSKSSSPPRMESESQIGGQRFCGDKVTAATVPALKPPVQPPLKSRRRPFANRMSSPQRWVEFDNHISSINIESNPTKVLTDFSRANRPISFIQSQPDRDELFAPTVGFFDQPQALTSSYDKENQNHLSGVALQTPKVNERISLLEQWNQLCDPPGLPVKNSTEAVHHTRPKRHPEPSEQSRFAHTHQPPRNTSASHSQCWTFTFYNFEDQSDVQDTDALVNSVFAVLLTQLRHGTVSFRNSSTLAVHEQIQSDQQPVSQGKHSICQSSHRHIKISDPSSAGTTNHTNQTGSGAFDVCVRWATGNGRNETPGRSEELENTALRKTYICATLSGLLPTELRSRKLARHSRRRRARRTVAKVTDQADRRCPCACQTASRLNANKQISQSHASSTVGLNDDESVACHSSSSSFRLNDGPTNRYSVNRVDTCERDQRWRRRRHSHCDIQRLSEPSGCWLKRRQVVSGDFQATAQIQLMNGMKFLEDRKTLAFDRAVQVLECPQIRLCVHDTTRYADRTHNEPNHLRLKTDYRHDRRQKPVQRSDKHIRTHSQPQTTQEMQSSILNSQRTIDPNCMVHWSCNNACRCSSKQVGPSELMQDRGARSRDFATIDASKNNCATVQSRCDGDQANQKRLNEFVSWQKHLVADRKTRHRYRRSLGQQHVKEWLGVALTLR